MNVTAATNNFHLLKGLTVTAGDAASNTFGVASNEITIGGSAVLTGGAGADSFYLNGGDEQFGGAVTVSAGGGANTVTLLAANAVVKGAASFSSGDHAEGTGALTVGAIDFTAKSLNVQCGNGDNTLSVFSYTLLKLAGDLTLHAGTGNELINFAAAGLVMPGSVKVSAGDGTNKTNVGIGAATINNNLIITGGSGSDEVTLYGEGIFKGALSIDTGAGDSKVTVTGVTYGLFFAKGATFKDAATAGQVDMLSIQTFTATGLVHITTGAAASTVNLDNLYLGKGLTVETGDGADNLNFEQRTVQ